MFAEIWTGLVSLLTAPSVSPLGVACTVFAMSSVLVVARYLKGF